MKTCRACLKHIPETARKCPHCGTSVIEETIDCPNCGAENDLYAEACTKCGFKLIPEKQVPPKPPLENIFDTSHLEKIEQDIGNRFSKAFTRRLEEEHSLAKHPAYVKRFYDSGFKTSVDYRIKQLVEELRKMEEAGGDHRKAKKTLLETAFEELLDYFIIRHCADLNETFLPEAILKYQGLPLDKIDPGRLIMDYLDFDNEEETLYTDFVSMPANKLKNAADAFLFPKKGETIFFISDLSVLGSCKEGFAMTKNAIYWKAMLEKPQRVYYHKLKVISRQEDWITINGIFFNAGKTLNFKLMRLLKKLKQLHGNIK